MLYVLFFCPPLSGQPRSYYSPEVLLEMATRLHQSQRSVVQSNNDAKDLRLQVIWRFLAEIELFYFHVMTLSIYFSLYFNITLPRSLI